MLTYNYSRLISLLFILVQSHSCFAQNTASLSIIIDDLGNSRNDFEAFKLPTQISFSILPFTPQAKKIAHQAHQQGRIILAHIPMQAKKDNNKLGKGALMLDMSETEFKTQLLKSLDYFPNAQGINNHMGSTLTELKIPMRWTMEVLQQKGLFFLDSRTTANTIAQSTAKSLNIKNFRRHVFLDNIKTHQAMDKQFQQAINLSKKYGKVIIIAHPYPETIQYLYQKISDKQTKDFTLIELNQSVSEQQELALLQKQ